MGIEKKMEMGWGKRSTYTEKKQETKRPLGPLEAGAKKTVLTSQKKESKRALRILLVGEKGRRRCAEL